MHITALDVIAPHARYKIWVKPNGEMPFLYGGNVSCRRSESDSTGTFANGFNQIVKAHVGRFTEDCPQHQGVIVLNMSDTPLVRSLFPHWLPETRVLLITDGSSCSC